MPHCIFRKGINGKNLLYAWTAAMHTRIDIVICSEQSEETLNEIVSEAVSSIKAIEKWGNRFDAESEVAAINRTEVGTQLSVSSELHALLQRCKDYNAATLGLFDITARPGRSTPQDKMNVPEAYNAERDKSIKGTDADKKCAGVAHTESVLCNSRMNINMRATAHTGDKAEIIKSEAIRLLNNGRLMRNDPEARIDLSAILKGYALDTAMLHFKLKGIDNALINIGNSSVGAMGKGPKGDKGGGWKVSFPGTETAVTLLNECLTTSGNDTEERRHIVNPRSGEVVPGCRSTAVITENGTDGEVLSTSLFIASADERDIITQNIQTKRIIYLSS